MSAGPGVQSLLCEYLEFKVSGDMTHKAELCTPGVRLTKQSFVLPGDYLSEIKEDFLKFFQKLPGIIGSAFIYRIPDVFHEVHHLITVLAGC